MKSKAIGFSFKENKKEVTILHYGKKAGVLRGNRALSFLDDKY